MLTDFFNALNVVLEDEKQDFELVKNELQNTMHVNFLPAVIDDLFPIYVLHDTKGKEFNASNVYIVPIGASDFWALQHFSHIITQFYNDEIIKKSKQHYGIKIKEMILLETQGCLTEKNFNINNKFLSNVVYIRLLTKKYRFIHVFLVASTPEYAFAEIIEKFDIPIHCIVESNKGMGSFYGKPFPVYERMAKSCKKVLLPTFYFAGKFAIPMDFETIYIVPESDRTEGISKIQKIDWNLLTEKER